MKKMVMSLLALSLMVPVIAQNQIEIEQITEEVTPLQAGMAPEKPKTIAQKLLNFEKAIDYLKGARDCLRGIGCSRVKSYFANFLLGAALGFAIMKAVFVGQLDPEQLDPEQLDPVEHPMKMQLCALIGGIGYHKLVLPDEGHLIRCLTFRGCNESIRRFAFYYLGYQSEIWRQSLLSP